MTFINDQQTNLSRRSLLQEPGSLRRPALAWCHVPETRPDQARPSARRWSSSPPWSSAQKGILTGAHWGAFEAIVADGRMVRVQPVADDPAPNDLIDIGAVPGPCQEPH